MHLQYVLRLRSHLRNLFERVTPRVPHHHIHRGFVICLQPHLVRTEFPVVLRVQHLHESLYGIGLRLLIIRYRLFRLLTLLHTSRVGLHVPGANSFGHGLVGLMPTFLIAEQVLPLLPLKQVLGVILAQFDETIQHLLLLLFQVLTLVVPQLDYFSEILLRALTHELWRYLVTALTTHLKTHHGLQILLGFLQQLSVRESCRVLHLIILQLLELRKYFIQFLLLDDIVFGVASQLGHRRAFLLLLLIEVLLLRPV